MKAKFDDNEKIKASLEEQIRELEENNFDLKGKLVKSPDRLHEEIREIEQKNADRARVIQDSETSISKMEDQIRILSIEADRHLECFSGEFNTVKNDIGTFENAQRSRNKFLMAIDREKSKKEKLESMKAETTRRFENDLKDMQSHLQRCKKKFEHFQTLTNKHNE